MLGCDALCGLRVNGAGGSRRREEPDRDDPIELEDLDEAAEVGDAAVPVGG